MSNVEASEFEEFKELISRLGSEFELAQGFGGNASVKYGSTMLVKASGKRLGAVNDEGYFYEVFISNGKYSDRKPYQSGRPSIETFLHAAFPQKYVVHLHSTFGVALSALAEKDAGLREKLHHSGVQLVRYVRPGQPLHLEIQRIYSGQETGSFLLQNHGTLFFSNSIYSLERMVRDFEELAKSLIKKDLTTLVRPESLDSPINSSQRWNAMWHALANWRVTPDHCVFLGPSPNFSTLRALALSKTSRELFALGEGKKGVVTPEGEQLGYFFNLSQCLPHQKFSTLSLSEALHLGGWELEKYRRLMASKSEDGLE